MDVHAGAATVIYDWLLISNRLLILMNKPCECGKLGQRQTLDTLQLHAPVQLCMKHNRMLEWELYS